MLKADEPIYFDQFVQSPTFRDLFRSPAFQSPLWDKIRTEVRAAEDRDFCRAFQLEPLVHNVVEQKGNQCLDAVQQGVVEQRHFQSFMLERMKRPQIEMREGFERIPRGGQASSDNCGRESDGRMLRGQIQPIFPCQPVASCYSGISGTQKKIKREEDKASCPRRDCATS